MKLLLDTHALIWFAEGDPKLSATAREILENEANSVFYSVACIWEMAIKISLRKLTMSRTLTGAFEHLLEQSGLILLPIEYRHAARVASLPFHHRDPFDRLLVAQAELEQFSLVSHDSVLDAYPIKRIW